MYGYYYWRQTIAAFSSYEGKFVEFCKAKNISKNKLYYYKKKFEKENNYKFHAISMKEEKIKTEITVVPAKRQDIRIEIA